MIYWDASALLKLYLTEPDSAAFVALAIESQDQIVSSAIVEVEMLCGLNRRERSGDLKPGGARTFYRRFVSDLQSRKI